MVVGDFSLSVFLSLGFRLPMLEAGVLVLVFLIEECLPCDFCAACRRLSKRSFRKCALWTDLTGCHCSVGRYPERSSHSVGLGWLLVPFVRVYYILLVAHSTAL